MLMFQYPAEVLQALCKVQSEYTGAFNWFKNLFGYGRPNQAKLTNLIQDITQVNSAGNQRKSYKTEADKEAIAFFTAQFETLNTAAINNQGEQGIEAYAAAQEQTFANFMRYLQPGIALTEADGQGSTTTARYDNTVFVAEAKRIFILYTEQDALVKYVKSMIERDHNVKNKAEAIQHKAERLMIDWEHLYFAKLIFDDMHYLIHQTWQILRVELLHKKNEDLRADCNALLQLLSRHVMDPFYGITPRERTYYETMMQQHPSNKRTAEDPLVYCVNEANGIHNQKRRLCVPEGYETPVIELPVSRCVLQ